MRAAHGKQHMDLKAFPVVRFFWPVKIENVFQTVHLIWSFCASLKHAVDRVRRTGAQQNFARVMGSVQPLRTNDEAEYNFEFFGHAGRGKLLRTGLAAVVEELRRGFHGQSDSRH